MSLNPQEIVAGFQTVTAALRIASSIKTVTQEHSDQIEKFCQDFKALVEDAKGLQSVIAEEYDVVVQDMPHLQDVITPKAK